MSRWKTYSDSHFYFITTTIVEWQYIFTSIPAFNIVLESLQYCIENKDIHLHAYVIMPNHAHYILSAIDGKHISNVMRDFNTHTSRELTALLTEQNNHQLLNIFRNAACTDRRGNLNKVWQDGFHPIGLITESFFRQKRDYVHNNPVRKGFVEKPEDWKYSSARNYILNDHSIIRVESI